MTATLTGLCNVRDLGGLPTEDGLVTRTGMLLRSDAPLPDDPAPTDLPAWPPASVLDLRAPAEAPAPHPMAASGASVFGVAVFDDLMLDTAVGRTWPPEGGVSSWFVRLYLRCLRERAAAVARAVSVIVSAPPPVLVHCAAGRDRTGIVVALVLRAAGVSRAEVVADYRRTEANHLRLIERLVARGAMATQRPGPAPTEVLATPAAIERVLDEVDAGPGGVHGWLTSHGVPGADLERWLGAFVGRA